MEEPSHVHSALRAFIAAGLTLAVSFNLQAQTLGLSYPELETRFQDLLSDRLQLASVTPESERELRTLADRAALAASQSPADAALVERNLGLLLEAVELEAYQQFGRFEVHESVVADALNRLCPLFPFC